MERVSGVTKPNFYQVPAGENNKNGEGTEGKEKNTGGDPDEVATLILTKQQRRAMQRSKARGSTKEHKEETFFETHLMPFLLKRIVNELISTQCQSLNGKRLKSGNQAKRSKKSKPVQNKS